MSNREQAHSHETAPAAGGHDHAHAHGSDNASELAGNQATTGGTSAATGGSGGTTATTLTKAAVVAQLAADQTYIKDTLLTNMAASRDVVVKNTASYCKNNSRVTGASRVDLTPIAPTHDSATRVTAAGKDPTKYKAWAWGTGYNAGADSRVSVNVNGLGGYHSGKRIGLVVTKNHSPSSKNSEATLTRFLVHEVQHDADHHESITEKPVTGVDAGKWNWFKTEFRSYWVDKGYSAKNGTNGAWQTVTVTAAGASVAIKAKNDRAMAIKSHIFRAGAYDSIVSQYTSAAAFKTQLDNHNQPDGVNVTNSPKVDDFMRSISAKKISNISSYWTALSNKEERSIRGNWQVDTLIKTAYAESSPHRSALLGFVHGKYQASEFLFHNLFATFAASGNEAGLSLAQKRLTAKAKAFMESDLNFQKFANHATSFLSGNLSFAAGWDGADLIRFMKTGKKAAPSTGGSRRMTPSWRGCFVPETPVLLGDGGTCPIGELKAGDQVLALCEETRRVTARAVLQTHRTRGEVLAITVSGLERPLRVTEKHRFRAGTAWIAANELTPGMELTAYDPLLRELQPRAVVSIERQPGLVEVANISVQDHPNYFVDGICAHNMKAM